MRMPATHFAAADRIGIACGISAPEMRRVTFRVVDVTCKQCRESEIYKTAESKEITVRL